MTNHKNTNIITYKIKYTTDNMDYISSCIKDYNKILKYTYNRIYKDKLQSTKELTIAQKKMNNVFLDSHFKNSAIFEAKGIINLNEETGVCFGKQAYRQYTNGKINKEELHIKKLIPLYSVGEASQKGNRKFRIISNRQIIFQPNKDKHIILKLENYKNYKNNLLKLMQLQNEKKIPITYKLDLQYVYITFDLTQLQQPVSYHYKKNRIFGIDLNPNYIGFVVVDWKSETNYSIIKEGCISLKDLNDYDNSLKLRKLPPTHKIRKYITNKRNYEVCKIAQYLCKLAKYYHCELFAMEDLTMEHKDNSKGKKFNRLVNNQWCRKKLLSVITKNCKLQGIKIQYVMANYSSFLGNLIYRQENLYDPELAALEISRRGYEFNLQYITKTKDKKKNIIFPELHSVKDRIDYALEVLGYSEEYENLKELYLTLKKMKLKYRLSWEQVNVSKFCSIFHNKSFVKLYNFK